MPIQTHKDLEPFSNDRPLVPGKGGGSLARWRAERDLMQLNNEFIELGKVTRRMSQELIETIIFMRDHGRRSSPEALARRISGILGALKSASATLSATFDVADLHPAFQRMFFDKALPNGTETPEPTDEELTLQLMPPAESIEIDTNTKRTLRHALSDREIQILTLLLAGEKPKTAGARLGITRARITSAMVVIRRKARELIKEGALDP